MRERMLETLPFGSPLLLVYQRCADPTLHLHKGLLELVP